jgi:hypothetical protein
MAIKSAKAVPVAKATKVTAEHHWSNGKTAANVQKVTPERADKFDGSKNTGDKADAAGKEVMY